MTRTRARRRIVPFGDSALMVVLGDGVDPVLNARVHRLAAAVRRLSGNDPRFGSPVPAYASVLVPTDIHATSPDDLIGVLSDVVDEVDGDVGAQASEPMLHAFPTRYGGEAGPDLDELAAVHDLRPADVIEIHASADYRVYFLGFAPGFAYLGRVPDAIATPRRAVPRQRVAAGSVGIGRDQTGIYPFEAPAGWHLIGRTDVTLWDPAADPPALLAPGDRVRFVPIG